MASLATHVRGTSPARAPEDSQEAARKKKDVTNKVKEHSVRDALSSRLGGMIEVLTPTGCIDCLTKNEVIEVKYYRNWKSGIGQVMSYGTNYPSHKKRLHLFAHKGDTRSSKYFEMATKIGMTCGIHVTFEEVLPGGNDLGANVVCGADVFSGAVVGAEGSGVSMGVKRPASEVAVEKPARRAKMEYKRGKKEQDKFGRRKQLIVEMNRLFLEWARLFGEENGSAKNGSPEARTLATIRDSKSISVVFAPSVRPEMAKMEEHRAFYEEFFAEFSSKSTCDRTARKAVTWENPPK